ncbi:hypothetical protein [Amycolatopsis vastitatis]|uniref:Uncharacterized protein n=1 Tax=Amycolatopsis vastitatis TaxID=1905142 RepID=A0A229SLV5_9PSEU|nr:hypothetical protein [Amycolatopsis vastitatis]OXM59641.1 hypothetical protein CF165_46445 [Amycolatopsis vastitatis]
MTFSFTSPQSLVGTGALLVLFVVWRFSARKARRAAEVARASAHMVSLAGRVVFTGAALISVQWLVITHPGNTTLLLVVLGVPDLIASYVLTRALTVTSVDSIHRGGRR